uniref:ATP synthase CF0 subunit I n=1 Tax=Athyrium clivicola TaxID=489863 RepID=UPI0026E28DCB|nr:ATP synthase CF0 subunit I [Athyrium clivicola]YP_010886165.1 ATP synthase CF0 subunit I [Athyrium otophorum]YP_010886254.1 ATP synthase CF0 subunit I [Athyrium reflexipinnum]YP_010886343.1 ATP synthase CF0 subunit I [Athyrium spinulosum]YP_010886521.1 ATP synthase CF0 subunit I [Athyrium wardii]WJH16128.1 ATP synthase CF0 subunit I [Athyrium clivicola]WJH16395.1 ATP synthase CF0 subunit I [Athyrium otophorum]WJH16484.1 ATP synthase CF0 subunit I [Athyrium reflexipinnum]WJH16573.1 ATP sy
MRSVSEIVAPSSDWTLAASIGLNTNILEINLINLILVLGILFYYGKGVLINFLDNRERTILNTIRDAEERHKEATKKLQKARIRLQQAKVKADEIRINGLTQMDREQRDLVDAADEDLKGLEDSKNYAIRFEKQRAIEQVRQQVSRLASERALESLNSRLDNQLHLRMIDYHIGLFRSMKNKSN